MTTELTKLPPQGSLLRAAIMALDSMPLGQPETRELREAIEAAQKVESIGQKLANAVVVKRGIDRRPSPVTAEERETLKKSQANLASMKAEIASLMRELEVNSITSGVCWATLYHDRVEIGAYI